MQPGRAEFWLGVTVLLVVQGKKPDRMGPHAALPPFAP